MSWSKSLLFWPQGITSCPSLLHYIVGTAPKPNDCAAKELRCFRRLMLCLLFRTRPDFSPLLPELDLAELNLVSGVFAPTIFSKAYGTLLCQHRVNSSHLPAPPTSLPKTVGPTHQFSTNFVLFRGLCADHFLQGIWYPAVPALCELFSSEHLQHWCLW